MPKMFLQDIKLSIYLSFLKNVLGNTIWKDFLKKIISSLW